MKDNQIFNPSGSGAFTESTEMRRDLGLFEAVSIVIGRIIGSGIFRTPGIIMALALSTSLFGAVWCIGAIITLLSALCYAELVAMMPRSGGPYVYLHAAYPPVWSFLRGWAMFFVVETSVIAAVALVFAEYLGALMHTVAGAPLPRPAIIITALAVIWILTSINCFGVFLSGIVQDVFSVVKIAAILGMVFICFLGPGSAAHFTAPFFPAEFGWGSVLAVGAGLRYAFLAFSGWEGATYIAEEVNNPRKNLPLSLFIGSAGIFIIYTLANCSYLYMIPPAEMAHSDTIAALAMARAAGPAGAVFISGAILVCTFGNVSTQILCKARSWYSMARDGLFFKPMASLNLKYKTPNASIILQGIWATVLLLFSSLAKNSYEQIIDFFSCTGIIFNFLTFATVIVFRKKYPDAPRPFSVPLYPWVVIIVLVFHILYFIITLITALLPSLLGLLLTSTGLLYYYRKKHTPEKKDV